MELAVVSGANRLNWMVQKREDYGIYRNYSK